MLTTAPLALGPEWLHPEAMLTNYGDLGFWIAVLVIFVECGLLLFFLPGDSLLFTVGLFVGTGVIHQPLWLACLILTISAFAGNVVGYEIGRVSGPAIFNRGGSRIFKPEHVAQFPDLHERVWKALKLASKCKQDGRAEDATDLVAAVDAIAEMFYTAKGSPERCEAYKKITDNLF